MTRLVAVLGYSRAGGDVSLHPICAARVARAEAAAGPDDVVLFTGWARRRRATSEAELMATAWPSGRVRACLVDTGARTTLGNALAVSRALCRLDADEVVLVTSSWHARRASVLTRAALLGSGARLHVATTAEGRTPAHGLCELAAWAAVPLLALLAAGTR